MTAWPTDPLDPPVGDGRAALLLDRAARLFFYVRAFGCTVNVRRQHVRFGSKADACSATAHVRFTP